MEEFSKISIHNHLGGSCADREIDESHEKVTSFDFEIVKEKLRDANENEFNLLALTQSNKFDYTNYLKVKEIAHQKNIELLPGIEINIKNKISNVDKFLHSIVIFDPQSNLEEIEINIDRMINENQENYVTLDQFLDIVIKQKCIIIPHAIKQESRSVANNPEILSELIMLSNSIPVVLEANQTYHKKTLKLKLKNKLTEFEDSWVDKCNLISSADRMHFSDIESPTYIWGSPTFDDLYYSCFMSETRIKRKSDLITKVNYISKIEIIGTDSNQLKDSKIITSHGLNSIIGPSGSGKTLLLDIIKRKLTGLPLDNKTISKDSDYSSLYDVDDIVLYDREGEKIDENSGYQIVEGEILYHKVISAYKSNRENMLKELDINIDQRIFDQLILNFTKEANIYVANQTKIKNNRLKAEQTLNNILSTIKFLDENKQNNAQSINYSMDDSSASRIETIISEYQRKKTDLDKIDKSINLLLDMGEKYDLNSSYFDDIKHLKDKLTNSIYLLMRKDIVLHEKYKSHNLKQSFIYKNVQDYNSKIGAQSKLINERKQSLLNMTQKFQRLIYDNIILSMNETIPFLDENLLKKAIVANKENNSRININKINTTFSKDLLPTMFPTNIGRIPKLKLSLFNEEILDISDITSVKRFLDVFVENDYNSKIYLSPNLEDFIDYKIELLNNDGEFEDIEKITAGNLSKIYINRMFENKIADAGSNVIVLYDQPDSNMEKAFILDELIPKISTIRDKYQIFITTHEPLLVVNADSNSIISSQNYKTASKGNSIKYVNQSFAGVGSKSSLIYEVAKLIDGHPNAIQKRSILYGGILSENKN